MHKDVYFCVMKKNTTLRIRELREDHDLTQKYVANILMCDQSLYSKYERGERELPLRMAVRLAAYYGVSVDYIVGLSDDKYAVKPLR